MDLLSVEMLEALAKSSDAGRLAGPAIDEKVTLALDRLVGEVEARLDRHGDSRDPAMEFALMLVDELRQAIGKPAFEFAAQLTRVICAPSSISAERLRKAWQRHR